MTTTESNKIYEILEFWWEAGREKWFQSTPEFDEEIRSRFEGDLRKAAKGDYDSWQETPHGALALLLLLDQFPRNLFRGSAESFAYDAKALAIARQAMEKNYHLAYPREVRLFFFLPFEHSENIEDQTTAVDAFRRWGDQNGYLYALIHMDVIRRFGHFPHRNALVGRETTPEEQRFLEEGGFRA
ncbi:DUF924 domain-containing protein [Pseudovibrio exalbescens]|uniref:DUF924 family protein n=1 Tax=Pseudovibrio exalbescens TaxID=197461 RepID=UPI00236651B8|nr:DUF924 family protein [Pseudovibrio exalbescens]MDD7909441.1 DUF924 domain-containing protein [Pseudovibrio exalbescens]